MHTVTSLLAALVLSLLTVIVSLKAVVQEYKYYAGDIKVLSEGFSSCNEKLTLRSESCELVWRKKDVRR